MVDLGDESAGWQVHLSVSAQEGSSLLEAASAIRVERGASLITSPDFERKQLILFSRENGMERARDAGIDLYQRLRRVAGLDAKPALVVSLKRPSSRKRRSRRRLDVTLMNEATRVLDSESHFEWAVVLAQTACEVYTREILEQRAAQLGDSAVDEVDCLPSANLANKAVRRAFFDMTGYAPPDDADWWSAYQAHAQRRHQIVHAGARITRGEAEASIEAAKALIEFLHWPSMTINDARR
jgi:hypothetical protein